MVECEYRHTDEFEDTICVNDKSENLADYVTAEICCKCKVREPLKDNYCKDCHHAGWIDMYGFLEWGCEMSICRKALEEENDW